MVRDSVTRLSDGKTVDIPIQEAEQADTVNRAKRVIDVVANSLIPGTWDYCGVSYPDGVTSVFVFKTGGSGGTTVSTVTLVNDAQGRLISATKS